MTPQTTVCRTGWLRDLPDPRDLLPTSPAMRECLGGLRKQRPLRTRRAASVDWREFLGPVGDQAGRPTAMAHACESLVQYGLRRAEGESFVGSARFLYHVARRLADSECGGGASLRTTLKALVRFGLPPERYWPYDAPDFDQPPDAFLYGFQRELHDLRYLRLAPVDMPGAAVLQRVRHFLAAGFICAFGFSLPMDASGPDVAYPTRFDRVSGGQSAVAVGFDDARRVRSDKGALLVRNSWGPQWGEEGYGWLPYRFVEEGLAADFWTLLSPRWLASGEFAQPGTQG